MQPDYVQIGERTYHGGIGFGRWGNERITIGKWCSISQGVKMLAGGNHRTDSVSTYPFDTLLTQVASKPTEDRSYDPKNGDIVVGNDVWIGYGASLCGSMTIGHGAVIAANAVVFTDIPPYAIAVGNPARVTKYRFDEATIERLLRVAWWDMPESGIRAYVDMFYAPVDEFLEFMESLPVMDRMEFSHA